MQEDLLLYELSAELYTQTGHTPRGKKMMKNLIFLEAVFCFLNDSRMFLGQLAGSILPLGHPDGNQVDGLPSASSLGLH